jgi:peptidoglycan hydrolase-like protein with peptidoglycan-binding domain
MTAFSLAGANVPAAAQSPPDTAAEVAFWNSVRDTRNPAEIKAYLDKFPNGTFAALARIRLQELERRPAPAPSPQAAPASPPPAPPVASPGTPVNDPASIREVQTKLYNLNYKISRITGDIDKDTVQAIRDWQRNVGVTPTGTITTDQLARLRAARIPSTWGAIAYATRGASGAVWGRSSREEAERDALRECRKRGGSKCSALTAAEKACGALGFYSARVGSTQHWGAYGVVRPTLAQATDSALQECRANARRPEACGVRMTFCADGSHKS